MPVSQEAVPLVVVFTLFLAIAFVAVGLRLYVRIVVLKNPGWDDWLCLASACCALATYLSNMGTVASGFGNPLSSLTPEDRLTALQTLWISPPLWGLSSALIKMSIVTSYLRIWSSRPFLHLSRLLLLLIAIFGLTLFLGGVLACIPISLSWQPPNLRDSNHCLNLPRFMFVTSTLNTALDLVVLSVPVPLLRRLQIARKQRIALLVVFTIGAIVCIASAMRLVSIYQLQETADPSTSGITLGLWSGVELTLAVICACLPTLRPVLARVFPRLLHTTGASSASTWIGTGTGTGVRGGGGARRLTGDENGTYRMRELPSTDLSDLSSGSDGNKPGDNSDVERGVIRVKSTIDIKVEQEDVDKHDRSAWI